MAVARKSKTEPKKLARATLKKSDRLKIVAEFGEFQGKDWLNVRQYARNKEGDFVPTPAGFNIEDTPEGLEQAKVFFKKAIRLIEQRQEEYGE